MNLIRIDNVHTGEDVGTIAVNPEQIAVVFWVESAKHTNQPCAVISMKDDTKIYWLTDRSGYDKFVSGLPSLT
jgi:hypothetical protein